MENVKLQHGWTPELENFLKSTHKTLRTDYNGSFLLRKVKGKYYWYYRLSSNISKRDKYLCPVESSNTDGSTSFQYACDILLQKVQSRFVISTRDKRYLAPYIDLYLDTIDKTTSIKKQTKRGTYTAARDFKHYCIENDIKLHIVPSNEMKQVYKDYMQHLYERQMARSSIKMYAQKLRYFLEWIVKDELVGGLELFPSQPLTVELQQALLNEVCGKIQPRQVKQFHNEQYEAMYKDTYDRIREIWNAYCDSGGVLPRIKDKNGKVNQPPHFLGRDVAYFISFFQLRFGLRVGEIFYTYRNLDIYNNYHLKNFPYEMATYFEKTADGWVLSIKNSKGKDRDVPVSDTVRSYQKPPEGIPFKQIEKDGKTYWDTPLVDVVLELFPQSFYAFPSPNHIDKPNQKRSLTYYMNVFKEELVIKRGWDRYGISSSHNLRSLFISYAVRQPNITPLEICAITGHTLYTMERYYIQENLQNKFKTYQKKMTQYGLIKAGRGESVDNN